MGSEIGIIIGGRINSMEDVDLTDVSTFEDVKIVDAGKLARRLETEGAKAIISTGGTVPEVERHVSIPVVTANPTYFDLLETLNKVETVLGIVNEKVALILHASRSISVERLRPFIRNSVSLFQYHDEEHLEKIVQSLFDKDFKVLVGGPTTMYFAKQLGMTAFLLALGRETMLSALEKTRAVLDLTRKEREQTQRLKTVLDIFPDGILATDNDGVITMCNPKALAILSLREEDTIGKKVYQVTSDPTWIDIYKKGEKQVEVLREYKHNKIFTTRQPVLEGGRIIGAVGTFQEATKIEKMEHHYRRIRTLGLTARFEFKDIIGVSDAMRKAVDQAKAYSKVEATVLIEGETGTGKEIFAQSIHNASPRRQGPFVAINCAALPETLLESELMGYEEGAFTGAKRGGRAGLFEMAHKGTIFLDEINQIPLQLQARVLRVIQEKRVLRLGGERVIPVDVHIIAAANENLEQKVQEGKFRDDLFFRINVLNLRLPPLKQRKEDILVLMDHFLRIFTATHGTVEGFSPAARALLMSYPWPGNVRELGNFVERYVVLNKQTAAVSDIDFVKNFLGERGKAHADKQNSWHDSSRLTVQVDTLESMQRQLIEQVVEKCGGNKIQASLLLEVSRTTIWNKLRS